MNHTHLPATSATPSCPCDAARDWGLALDLASDTRDLGQLTVLAVIHAIGITIRGLR